MSQLWYAKCLVEWGFETNYRVVLCFYTKFLFKNLHNSNHLFIFAISYSDLQSNNIKMFYEFFHMKKCVCPNLIYSVKK